MQGALVGTIDVAQIVLYAFWIFFFGLIVYLRREDRREGYPVVHDRAPRARPETYDPRARRKVFVMADGKTRTAPRDEPKAGPVHAVPTGRNPGAPLTPVGNPLLAGVGPGAWVERADEPDRTHDEHLPKIVPLRAAPGYHLEARDPDPRGYAVIGGDRRVAGKVVDVWVDRSETMIRYFEVEVAAPAGPKRVLVPGPLIVVNAKERAIVVKSILASQFADVPTTKHPDEVTLREEDQIVAYYGAGTLYATPGRVEPLL